MRSPKESNTNTSRHLFHISIALIILFPWPWFFKPGEFKHIVSIAEFAKFWMIFQIIMVPFYFLNSYLLVTYFLKKRKYGLYTAMLLACLLLSVLLKTALQPLFSFTQDFATEEFFKKPFHILPLLMIFALGTCFEMIISWEKQGRKEEEIEKEKIGAELSFLKSQINPHFLFNSLNNIYSLSEKKSDQAGEAVLLLSNIMRYVLYDTNHGKIQLKKEIQHLENYIAMQRLRISGKENVHIQFNYHGDIADVLIEPLLLIPFVENAFKHGISYDDPSKIIIELQVTKKVFTFGVLNGKKRRQEPSIQHDIDHGGVGITNTKRRLELMYRHRYELSIEDSADRYYTHLTIRLTQEEDWSSYAPLKIVAS